MKTNRRNMRDFTKQISKRFSILVVALVVIIGGFTACSSNRSDSTNAAANLTTSTPVSSSGSGSENVKTQEQEKADAEKEKLQKDREKLEREKQELKDEKAKMERMKGADSPSSEITNTVTTVDPPSNIRDAPNGKILCTVKNQATFIKLYGSTGITDNNGEWFYTKHCGKMGVIHSTQFVSAG